VAMGAGFRFGLPFFLPIDYYDTRIQVLDNVSLSRGNHLIKFGAEWNRVNSVQTFIGFANSRYIFSSVSGFLGYLANDSLYVECSNSPPRIDGTCPGGTITGPVLLYLQQAGVDRSVRASGTQSIPQNELALYLQDTWRPNARWTVNYGVRWEAQVQPDLITPRDSTFYAVYYDSVVTNGTGTYAFPGDGTIPSDWKMFQPRLGVAFDPDGTGRQVFRGNFGIYHARIPGLNLASSRSTDGARGQTLFGSSGTVGFLPPPSFPNLFPDSIGAAAVAFPSVFVFDRNFRNPRTINFTVGYERQFGSDLAASLQFTHARTDYLTRFIDGNAAAFGSPWGSGPRALTTLTVIEASARSRYNGITAGVRRVLNPNLQFQANYTLSWDKSDDDNERDPFSFRYARADSLEYEYNWSDRDQRHRLNAWILAKLPGDVFMNNRISAASAQPRSAKCVGNVENRDSIAVSPGDRVCGDGHIIRRNTIRKDNALFTWDVRLSRPMPVGRGQLEIIVEVFNVTNADNFKDPSAPGLLFNFDGTLRSGLGDPRQVQAGLRWVF